MRRIVILGAGTAGSSTAIEILKSNPDAKVLLIDKNFSRKPVRCAAGVSAAKLKKVGFDFPEELIACRITCFRVYSPDLNFWDFKSMEPVGYILKRDAFDRYLIKEAERLGAQLLEMAVRTLKELPDYDVLVLADGFPSLARSLGHPQPKLSDIEYCIQKIIKWRSFPRDRIDIYFKRFSPGGYAWCFPKDRGECRIGLGVPLDLDVNVKSLLDFFSYHVAYDLKDRELIAKMLPLCGPPKTGVYGNVLLVGDALPSIDPAFGGGIVESIVCGQMAARAILEGNLKNYDKYWRESLGKENRWRYRVKRVLVSLTDKEWNWIVKKLRNAEPRFEVSSAKVLRKVVKWTLLRNPKLLWKFIGSLVR